MSRNCYKVALNLKTVAAAEGKSIEAAVLDLQTIPEWCSQKEN